MLAIRTQYGCTGPDLIKAEAPGPTARLPRTERLPPNPSYFIFFADYSCLRDRINCSLTSAAAAAANVKIQFKLPSLYDKGI